MTLVNNKQLKQILIINALAIVLQACGGGGSTSTTDATPVTPTPPVTDDTGNNNNDNNNSFDITEYIFAERNADCANYTNNYQATVTDITVGVGFDASVVITADENHCTFVSNAIPNHHFNDDSAHFANQVAEQQQSYQISRNPTFAVATTGLSQQINNGMRRAKNPFGMKFRVP